MVKVLSCALHFTIFYPFIITGTQDGCFFWSNLRNHVNSWCFDLSYL